MIIINNVCITGRLVADPEVNTTVSGHDYCAFAVAVRRPRTRDDVADYVDCVAWDATARFLRRYWRKGQWVAVVGTLVQSRWTDNDGKKHSCLEVRADDVGFCGKRDAAAQRDADLPF